MKILFTLILVLFSTNVFANKTLEIARSQIGQGEIGGDNKGNIVKKYTRGQEVAWCSAFVSWTLQKAGKNTPYMLQARNYLKVGKAVTNPAPGDIIVFKRGIGNQGHVGIIEKVTKNQIVTIEGNVGKYPAKVKRITYKRNNIKNLLGFRRV